MYKYMTNGKISEKLETKYKTSLNFDFKHNIANSDAGENMVSVKITRAAIVRFDRIIPNKSFGTRHSGKTLGETRRRISAMRQDAQAVISIKHIPGDTVSCEPNSRPRNIDIAVLGGLTYSDESTAIDWLEYVNQSLTSGSFDPIHPIELCSMSSLKDDH